jgi:hypothetical protein
MEHLFGFAMDLAWDVSKLNFDMIPAYLELYAEREFGIKHADAIATLLMDFNHLIGMRRFEMGSPGNFFRFELPRSRESTSEMNGTGRQVQSAVRRDAGSVQSRILRTDLLPVGIRRNILHSRSRHSLQPSICYGATKLGQRDCAKGASGLRL